MRLHDLHETFQPDQLTLILQDRPLNESVQKLYTQGIWNAADVFMLRNAQARQQEVYGKAFINDADPIAQ